MTKKKISFILLGTLLATMSFGQTESGYRLWMHALVHSANDDGGESIVGAGFGLNFQPQERWIFAMNYSEFEHLGFWLDSEARPNRVLESKHVSLTAGYRVLASQRISLIGKAGPCLTSGRYRGGVSNYVEAGGMTFYSPVPLYYEYDYASWGMSLGADALIHTSYGGVLFGGFADLSERSVYGISFGLVLGKMK